MQVGHSLILICPYCGGKKAVLNLISGNTGCGTLWSDTRSYYPMLPEVSAIQKCKDCGKFYFFDEAKKEQSQYSDSPSYSMDLGTLDFDNLISAKKQFDLNTLTRGQLWILHRYLMMAYNDRFQRNETDEVAIPSDEERVFFENAIDIVIKTTDDTDENLPFLAELLREKGKFTEAFKILDRHNEESNKWVVNAMLKKLKEKDSRPFLLVKDGEIMI